MVLLAERPAVSHTVIEVNDSTATIVVQQQAMMTSTLRITPVTDVSISQSTSDDELSDPLRVIHSFVVFSIAPVVRR